MEKVYLLINTLAYEGDEVVSVHKTKKVALKKAAKLANPKQGWVSSGTQSWERPSESIRVEEKELEE